MNANPFPSPAVEPPIELEGTRFGQRSKAAAELRALPSPNEAAFYTSGRTRNETAFLYQLFVSAYGTNNLPDRWNMCNESSGSALGPTLVDRISL